MIQATNLNTWVFALALACQVAAPPAAAAQVSPARILDVARQRNPACRVSLVPGSTVSGLVRGAQGKVTIAQAMVSDCGGGINYTRELVALPDDAAGGAAYAMDPRMLGRVTRAAIEHGVIVVDFVSFGPHDAYCCPSVKGRARLIAQGSTLVAAP